MALFASWALALASLGLLALLHVRMRRHLGAPTGWLLLTLLLELPIPLVLVARLGFGPFYP